jgi:hypothetical protein
MYVYAVVDAGADLSNVRGLSGEPVRAVACGGVAAAVGDLAGEPELTAETLKGHDEAVRRIAAVLPAVLPARFGTVLADEGALRDALGSRDEPLRSALEAVRGREQMTLRLALGAGAPVAAEPAEGGPGLRYLEARSGTALRRRPDVARLLDGMGDLVRAERIERIDRPPLLGTVHHLVDRGSGPAYRERLDRLRGETPGLVSSVTGPWPPYAFVEADW